MRALVNAGLHVEAVPPPAPDAPPFHAAMEGYRPTPLRDLALAARELGVERIAVKDESDRFGLPAFKVLGASWAVERALTERPDTHTLVAASAGNHGRAVAHMAARRGLKARIYLPRQAAPARQAAIRAEGAEVVVIDGGYEEAVALAEQDGRAPGMLVLADVGASGPAAWVVDGYATLFAEVATQGTFDAILVPVGVGSFAAAAARFGAAAGVPVIGVEPEHAACLTASLAAGRPAGVPTPGTSMAGMDCAEVSLAAWPVLQAGITGTVTIRDAEAHAAMRELAAQGLAVGDCGAAPLAALRALVADDDCAALRERVGIDRDTRVLLVATEGATDPAAYDAVVTPR